jgi:hypothetical protein
MRIIWRKSFIVLIPWQVLKAILPLNENSEVHDHFAAMCGFLHQPWLMLTKMKGLRLVSWYKKDLTVRKTCFSRLPSD